MKALSPPRLIAGPMLAILVLPGCRENTEARLDPLWWSLESDRVELAGRVELMKMRLSKVEDHQESVADLEAALDRAKSRQALLAEEAGALEDEIAVLSEQVASTRDRWIQTARNESVGRSFATFSGARGRTYEDVEITAITDIGVEFKHASGRARLAAADLTDAQRRDFGLDPQLAREALKEERAIANAYGSWVDQRVAAVEAEKEEAEIALAVAEPVRRVAAKLPATASVSATGGSRLREEPRYFSRGYNRSRGYTVWYPTYIRSSSYCYGTPSYSTTPVPSYNWNASVGYRAQCLRSPVVNATVYPRRATFYTTP